MFVQPLYITEDKQTVALQVSNTGKFTDIWTNHRAVIATPAEAQALQSMAMDNLCLRE